jgi:hypothetical protein
MPRNGPILKRKLRQWVRDCDVQLTPRDRVRLADSLYDMITKWLQADPAQEDEVLEASKTQIVRTFSEHRQSGQS